MTQESKPANASNMGIHQFNLSYNPEQDRLLFRIGLHDNSELQVWLTFRICKQLWQLLSGKTHLPIANSIAPETPPQQALEQFKQEAQVAETLQKMDFVTEYQQRDKVQNDGPMLAVLLNYEDAKPAAPVLHITCLEGMTINMNLNQQMILAICNMLQLATKETGWDIGAPVAILAPQEPAAQKVLH